MYSDVLVNYFEDKRHRGALSDNTFRIGKAQIGNKAMGMIALILEFDADERIQKTAFKAYGCPATIASAAWLCDALQGKTLREAHTIRSHEIVDQLNLPDVKIHAALLAEDVLQAALTHYHTQTQEQ